MVTINFKDIKKRCVFFVVPRNGQVLLGMPDTAALQIININIYSIQVVKEECITNIGNAKESSTTQEAHVVEKSYTNTDAGSKADNNVNGHNDKNIVNAIINYFLSLHQTVEADKRKGSKLTQRVHIVFGNVFTANWVL